MLSPLMRVVGALINSAIADMLEGARMKIRGTNQRKLIPIVTNHHISHYWDEYISHLQLDGNLIVIDSEAWHVRHEIRNQTIAASKINDPDAVTEAVERLLEKRLRCWAAAILGISPLTYWRMTKVSKRDIIMTLALAGVVGFFGGVILAAATHSGNSLTNAYMAVRLLDIPMKLLLLGAAILCIRVIVSDIRDDIREYIKGKDGVK